RTSRPRGSVLGSSDPTHPGRTATSRRPKRRERPSAVLSGDRDRVGYRLGRDTAPAPDPFEGMGAPRERRRIDPELFPSPGVAFGDPQVLAGDRFSVPQELHVGRASRELLAFVALVGEHLIPP